MARRTPYLPGADRARARLGVEPHHREVSLDPHPSYPKAPPKLWVLLSDGSHRTHIIWWGILLKARSRECRQLPTNGAVQNAAVRRQTLLLAPSTTIARGSSNPPLPALQWH